MFAILAAVGSGAAMLLKDLEDPFQGSFCINLAAKQLESLDELLVADIEQADMEQQQVGRPAFLSLDRNRPRLDYNVGNTIYFHLLTGPFAANVKFMGDIFAWTVRKLTKTWKSLWKWPRRSRNVVEKETSADPKTSLDIAEVPPLREQLKGV